MEKKVYLNTEDFLLQRPGGGEVIILKLLNALQNLQVNVKLFDPWKDKIQKGDIFHHFSLHGYEKWLYWPSIGAEFVLTPTAWPKDGLWHRFRYNLTNDLKELMWKDSFKSPSVRYALQKAPRLIFPTTEIEKEKLKLFYQVSSEKMHIIPNGVDQPKSVAETKRDYLLFVGNITPNKNLDYIIKAAKALCLELYVIGGAKEGFETYYENCQKMGRGFTHFLGSINNDSIELAKYYQAAKAVVVASDFETCSLVGLEAGSYATNVVMTEVGGTKEVFKGHVHYCKPKDVSSIVNAIQSFKQNENLTLKQYVLDNYSWDQIAQKLLALYKTL